MPLFNPSSSGGVSDGDKGDITVSDSGATWNIDAGVVGTTELGGDITTAGKALLDDADNTAQRTTLGLGTIATQNANSVSISGGSITGITDLAIADGGTGQSTATAAFDALAPTTTQGDVIYHNGTDNVRLAPGTAGDVLTTGGAGANPSWETPAAGSSSMPRGHLWGLTMSNAADPTNDVTVAVGEARNEAHTADMVLVAAITKQIDAGWAVGTNAGGLNTGAVAADTWYEVHLIKRSDTGVVDVMFTTTANRATLPANYDSQRRIGWVRNNAAGDLLAFTQVDDYITLTTPVNDVSATATASATSRTLTAPPNSVARFRAACLGNTGVNAANAIVFSELVETDTAPTTTNGFNSIGAGDFPVIGAAHIELRVSSASQIRDRAITATGTMAYDISTFGWIDGRTKLSNT